MSIRDAINGLLNERPPRLFRLKPLNEKDPKKRTVLMSQEIAGLVYGPWLTGPMGNRCARLRGDLENLVTAENITVCWEPFEGRHEQIGRLCPVRDEVWDLRSQDPPPGLRVFFRFAEKDIFVAINCAPRSLEVPWLNRIPLLGRKTRQWRNAVIECRAEWKKLFPSYDAHTGSHINEYITGGHFLR
jgi:hypothetical protein